MHANPDPDPDPDPNPNPNPYPSPDQAQRAAAVGRERAIERLADDAANVDNIDMAELQRRHRLLAAAYRADRKRIEQLQALNQQYATSLSTQEQLQSAYATLKEAHKQQAAQMLRLQDEAKKAAQPNSNPTPHPTYP